MRALRTTLVRFVTVTVAVLGMNGMQGCYEKVVSARGPGADKTRIEKGNLPDPKGDKTLGYKKIELKKLPGE
jgi:hypothetical protein